MVCEWKQLEWTSPVQKEIDDIGLGYQYVTRVSWNRAALEVTVHMSLLAPALEAICHRLKALDEVLRDEPLDDVCPNPGENLPRLVERLSPLRGAQRLPSLSPDQPGREQVLPGQAMTNVIIVRYELESRLVPDQVVHGGRDVHRH